MKKFWILCKIKKDNKQTHTLHHIIVNTLYSKHIIVKLKIKDKNKSIKEAREYQFQQSNKGKYNITKYTLKKNQIIHYIDKI